MANVTVITTFKERRREKEMKYERKVMSGISLEKLYKEMMRYFQPLMFYSTKNNRSVEEGCLDIAVEAFLLGAKYSRFGYYGEQEEKVRARSEKEGKKLVSALFEYLSFWTEDHYELPTGDGLYMLCEAYVDGWWTEGFRFGKKRYALKLS
jgi:hypothetical protein